MPIVRFAKQCLYQPEPAVLDKTDDEGKPMLGPLPERMLFERDGEYDLPDDVADHWYIKSHLVGFVDPMPPAGTYQYAQEMLNASRAARLNEPMSEMGQPAAPVPDGTVKAVAVRFAGGPVADREAQDRPSFLMGGAPPR